jgi:hypothetical protein
LLLATKLPETGQPGHPRQVRRCANTATIFVAAVWHCESLGKPARHYL